MSLNNGKGKSIDNFTIEYPEVVKGFNLAACKHANGIDWWIINFSLNTKTFYRVLLTKDGISGPWEQEGGPPRELNISTNGQSVFSPDGKKFVFNYSKNGIVWVLDFDRKTGLFSNLKILDYGVKPDWDYNGVAISPNSQFLYVAAGYYLYQYDLMESNIQQSKVLIDSNDGYNFPGLPNYIVFGFEQLGPDGKIYVGQYSGSCRQWSIINKPNEKGKDCDFKQHSLLFPVWSFPTVPIQPHFRLEPDTTTATTDKVNDQIKMKSWFDPITKNIRCLIQNIYPKNDLYQLKVVDISGKIIINQEMINPQFQEDIKINGTYLIPGLYFIQVLNSEKLLITEKVIVF